MWWVISAWGSDVLFVGNSYTFVHDLDVLTREALAGDGDSGLTVRLAEGGLRWIDHVNRAEALGTAWERALVDPTSGWTWGILQEQSQIPGFPEGNAELVASREAARTLDGWLEDRGADTVLLMTWGRRDGDPDNPDLYPDFATMQERLAAGTQATADALSTVERPVRVAPAGLAFAVVHDREPETFPLLYGPDGSHPSLAGEWLAAAVLYGTLTGHDPTGLAAPVGVSPELWTILTTAARDVTWEPPETTIPTDPESGAPGDPDLPDEPDRAAPVPAVAADCGCRHAAGGHLAGTLVLVGWLRRPRPRCSPRS